MTLSSADGDEDVVELMLWPEWSTIPGIESLVSIEGRGAGEVVGDGEAVDDGEGDGEADGCAGIWWP
jgi:hypothetical protein